MGKAGAVLGIVGVVILIAAMVGTWWSNSVSASALGQTWTGQSDYGLLGGQATSNSPAGSRSEPIDYAQSRNVQAAFQMTSVLLLLAILLGVLFVVVGALSWRRSNLRKAAAILGVLAFALALLAPLYLMAALPAAINNDSGTGGTGFEVTGFWGSQTTTFFGLSATAAWGPGWAWYLTLAAAIVLLVGGVAAFRAPRPATPVAGYAPYPTYVYGPPQQPPPPP